MYRNSVNCLKIKNEFTTYAVAFRITVIWIKQKYAFFKFIHYTNCKNYSEVASFFVWHNKPGGNLHLLE